MNRIRLLIISTILSSLIFITGCTGTTKLKQSPKELYATFKISGVDSRTALPEAINWGSYTYSLQLTEGYETSDVKDERTVFTGKTYSELSVGKVPVNPTKYKFTLVAYSGSTPVLSGEAIEDFSLSGARSVTFIMYPVTGAKGAAVINLVIPNDGVIKTIKSGNSTNPIETFANTKNQQTVNVTSAAGEGSTTYQVSFTDLSSAISQFALLYFYDEAGAEICSFPEAMIIVGGLTSVSTITITDAYYHRYSVKVEIRKDNEIWKNTSNIVKLVNGSTEYVLKMDKDQGIYTGSVAEGTYDVYLNGSDTGVDFNSVAKEKVINLYSITKTPGVGVQVTAPDLVLAGESFNYTCTLKNGFSAPANFTVNIAGITIGNESRVLGEEYTCQDVAAPVEIVTSSATAIEYTITYHVSDSEGTWSANANKPVKYTVLDTVDLPTGVDLRGNGKFLDGWKLSESATEGIGYIQAGTCYENLDLYPIWKDSAYADTASKIIYANGISLIIQESGTETHIYLDVNRNGIVDAGDDIQLVAADGTKDFTDYELLAGNKDNTPIASDFTFTMTGGTIASITGMGANAANRSVLNISGTAKIGSYIEILNDDDSYSYTDVKGVNLSSIYQEWVVVNGQMSGDYRVVLITQYDYDANVNHYVGKIGNASWASFKNFSCYKQTGENSYKVSKIVMKNTNGGTIIRLANPDAIAMPGLTGDDAIIGSVTEGFTLGDDRITTECSVFSVSVKDGKFTVPTVTLEGGTQYLAQPTATSYAETLDTEQTYVYMHVLSETNEITAENASKFLAGMVFRRDKADVPVKVKVNLETVSFEEISNPSEITLVPDESKGALYYFDGSFYIGITKSGSNWIDSYNNAKNKRFNGMQGYLINITSDVENNYIYSRMHLGQAWTGGARYDTAEDHNNGSFTCVLNESYHVSYDSDSRESPGTGFRIDSPHYRWQSGPEAGKIFTTGTIPYGSWDGTKLNSENYESSNKRFKTAKAYTDEKVIILDSNGFKLWEGKLSTQSSGSGFWKQNYFYLTGLSINGTPANIIAADSAYETSSKTSSTGYGYYTDRNLEPEGPNCCNYSHWDPSTPEPNDSNKGQSEECVHFLDGGLWNDFSWNFSGVNGYIVEFTPYKTIYGEQKASYEAITKSAEY